MDILKQLFKKRTFSAEEIPIEKDFVAYCFTASGRTYPEGGMFTKKEFINAFGDKYADVLKAMGAKIVIVEHELLSEIKYGGPSGNLLTYNSWEKVPSKLLEYRTAPGSAKRYSPRARISEIQKIIKDSVTDLEKLKEKVKNLELSAGHVDDTLLRIGNDTKDTEIMSLMQSGGLAVVPLELMPLQKEIARIEKAKELVGGYARPGLDFILGLNPDDFSEEFYRGKPLLTMKQKETKSGAEHLLKERYLEVFIPEKLTSEDVQLYRKKWEKIQRK